MDMIKISIIMPVYNVERTIERALDSVKYQTYKNFELIIIDGGSTDKTNTLIEKYKDMIYYFISEKDRGYADALNKGIAVATGDYSIILAADDFFLPNAMEQFVKSVKDGTEIWCGNMFVLKEPGILTKFKRAKNLKQLERCRVMAHPATFFKLDIFSKYGNYNLHYKINSDTELILRMYKKGAIFQLENYFIVVFSCGGMSTSIDIDGSIRELKGISKAEEVAIQHGLSARKAHLIRKKMVYRKKIGSIVKKYFNRFHANKFFYFLIGQRALTKRQIKKYAIPLEYIV